MILLWLDLCVRGIYMQRDWPRVLSTCGFWCLQWLLEHIPGGYWGAQLYLFLLSLTLDNFTQATENSPDWFELDHTTVHMKSRSMEKQTGLSGRQSWGRDTGHPDFHSLVGLLWFHSPFGVSQDTFYSLPFFLRTLRSCSYFHCYMQTLTPAIWGKGKVISGGMSMQMNSFYNYPEQGCWRYELFSQLLQI